MIGTAVAAEKSSMKFFDCVGDPAAAAVAARGSCKDIESEDEDYCLIEF